jgi:hypothetical protein
MGAVHIFHSPGLASRRCCRLSSNVRRRNPPLSYHRHMHSATVLALSFASASALAQTPSVRYLPNERFVNQIGDIEPMLWKDFVPLRENASACLKDKKSETPVCERVQEKMRYALYDALNHAHVLNAIGTAGEPKFCDEYGRKLILDKKFGQAVMYSFMIVDERMKYGSGLYGDALQLTYLGKLVHDYLMESQPCKP